MIIIIRLTSSTLRVRLTDRLTPLLAQLYSRGQRATDAAAAADDDDDARDTIANNTPDSLPSPHNILSVHLYASSLNIYLSFID